MKTKPATKQRKKLRQTVSWQTLIVAWLALTIGAAVLAAGFVRPFVVEAFQIPSKAMYPTLIVGDHIFTDKRHRAPSRGDVIVFRYPLDPSVDYIKRVIGLAGDLVEISYGKLRKRTARRGRTA